MDRLLFSAPTESDLKDLAEKEDWIACHYPEERREQYEQLGSKLILLQQILDEEWIDESDPECRPKFQCLGATFGAAMVQYYPGMHWVIADDEIGRDLCLRFEDTSIQVNPLTLISKRIERGETVDVKQLFISTCKWIDESRANADIC